MIEELEKVEFKTLQRVKLVSCHAKPISGKILTSRAIYELMKDYFEDELDLYEKAYLLMFDVSLKTINIALLSTGSINGTLMDPRIIMKYAVDSLATSIALVHNHPSNNLLPSSADKLVTEKIRKCCSYFDIKFIDHVIIGQDNFFSFQENGLL